MPQLDSLTYFSQYVWLIITFACVYYFVIQFIIPSTASALKLRAKLNSSNILKEKLNQGGETIHTHVDLIESNIACESWSSSMTVDHDLCFAQTGQWLKSSSAMQKMECMGAKKRSCSTLLVPFRQ